ncbi:MAG: VanZ family protein [Phycisphaerales bacterium]|nr:VanZ family protein [Phycisphaerales bacterium]
MHEPFYKTTFFRRAVLILYWTMIFTATHVPKVPSFVPKISNIDLLAHFLMYSGWASLCWWALADNRGRVSWAWIVSLTIIAAAYAAFDELTQDLVGRTPSIADFLANMCGAVLVLLLLQAWSRRRR